MASSPAMRRRVGSRSASATSLGSARSNRRVGATTVTRVNDTPVVAVTSAPKGLDGGTAVLDELGTELARVVVAQRSVVCGPPDERLWRGVGTDGSVTQVVIAENDAMLSDGGIPR